MAKKAKKALIEVEMPVVDVKGKVVKFVVEDEDDSGPKNIYVPKKGVAELGGCEGGVRVTVEAL